MIRRWARLLAYPLGADGSMLPMEKWSEANRRAVGQVLQQTFLGSRAEIL